MVEQHQQELKKQLWSIANTLRGNMSADDCHYVMTLLEHCKRSLRYCNVRRLSVG
ncbi:hypothetical protein ACKC6U_003413 [Vibrio vulnificus]